MTDLFEASTDLGAYAPLADRMRPREPSEFVGQEHLLGPGRALRGILDEGLLVSFVLWGPPGSGKTTIARMVAERADAEFVELSAVSDGIPRIREVTGAARDRLLHHQRRTVLFVDEIHRWNTTAQDAVLPHVERGTVVLIGATTENVSFELRAALLSRVRIFRLEPLETASIRAVLERALGDPERGLGEWEVRVGEEVFELLAEAGDGDVRRSLSALELGVGLAGRGGELTPELASEAAGRVVVRHDKRGDAHYDLASALQKSARGSDVDAALYYLARMLEGGDVAMAIRRMLVIASEDVGMADPRALLLVKAAAEAYERLGPPEGEIPLAHAMVYLATAPKSNRAYKALRRAREAVRDFPSAPVPLHLRNAPTDLLKEMGHGAGYEYPFDTPEHFSPQPYLPEPLRERSFYDPSSFGFEKEVLRRLEWWRKRRRGGPEGEPAAGPSGEGESPPRAEGDSPGEPGHEPTDRG